MTRLPPAVPQGLRLPAKLKVTTEVISHNNPDEKAPPLRTYEAAFDLSIDA
jgi:hypothetical protein